MQRPSRVVHEDAHGRHPEGATRIGRGNPAPFVDDAGLELRSVARRARIPASSAGMRTGEIGEA